MADTTILEKRVVVQNGAVALDVGDDSAPASCDWDNDGDNDLILGLSTDGGILRLYENIGTDQAPVFNGYRKLMSAGVELNDAYC
jgi:hypothetical protein